MMPNAPRSPFGNFVVAWTGYPDYRGHDAGGMSWWAYGPPPRIIRTVQKVKQEALARA